MKMFDKKPTPGTEFFVLMILDPDQNVPIVFGWGTELAELRELADRDISTHPRRIAHILKTLAEVTATTSIRELDPASGIVARRGAVELPKEPVR